MLLYDKLTVDSVRRTADGYLVADAKIARTGIQVYLGSEVGKPEMRTVRVYRPEEEVFHNDSLSSFAHRPITLDHPPVMVSAKNWKKYAVGQAGNEVARDGEFVRIPMMVTDQAAIDAWEDGKRELSNGYDCTLDFTPGTAPGGEAYDAVQRRIRGNHIAIVDRGRAGSQCRIGDTDPDFTPEPLENNTMNLKKITFDGMSIEVTEQGEQAILKLQGQLKDATTAKDGALGQVATLTTQLADANAKTTTLTTQLADAALTPQKLRDAAKAFALVVDQAKKLVPSLTISDTMDDAAIRKAVVTAKVGDAAVKDWNEAQFATSFATLAAGLKDAATTGNDPLRDALLGGVQTRDGATEVETAHTAMVTGLEDAWKGDTKAA